jgi:hypothetical protein
MTKQPFSQFTKVCGRIFSQKLESDIYIDKYEEDRVRRKRWIDVA